jgi:hypothetical protein
MFFPKYHFKNWVNTMVDTHAQTAVTWSREIENGFESLIVRALENIYGHLFHLTNRLCTVTRHCTVLDSIYFLSNQMEWVFIELWNKWMAAGQNVVRGDLQDHVCDMGLPGLPWMIYKTGAYRDLICLRRRGVWLSKLILPRVLLVRWGYYQEDVVELTMSTWT